MPKLCCPVCGDILWDIGKSLRCAKGHTYDKAKQGYVNLLMSNQSSKKRHGDDKEMVLSRQSFLEKGYYEPLRSLIAELCVKHSPPYCDLLDAGCGEGWYTAGIKQALGDKCSAIGLDISRDAVVEAAKREAGIELAVASVSNIPVQNDSCDIVLSIFAPEADEEFLRILRKGGILIHAVPLEEHLFGLKKEVYENPYLNPPAVFSPYGFELLERREQRYELNLNSNEDIISLFKMTPYYYKTGREDQRKLESLSALKTEAAFCVFVHKKI